MKYLLIIILFFSFIRCEKEKTEQELLNDIVILVKKLDPKKTDDTLLIKNEIKPIIEKLYYKDTIKYKIVNNIVSKILLKNNNLYKYQIEDLKKELNFKKKQAL